MPGKPFVLMYRSMNGFPGIHPLGDRSIIPLSLLYIRVNGIFDHATAFFRIKGSQGGSTLNLFSDASLLVIAAQSSRVPL